MGSVKGTLTVGAVRAGAVLTNHIVLDDEVFDILCVVATSTSWVRRMTRHVVVAEHGRVGNLVTNDRAQARWQVPPKNEAGQLWKFAPLIFFFWQNHPEISAPSSVPDTKSAHFGLGAKILDPKISAPASFFSGP